MNKRILIIGGSKGIGRAIVNIVLPENEVINLSRTRPEIENSNFKHHQFDALNSEFPEIDALDCLIYCPGSINLKPISRLDLDEFRSDFELNVIGAVRAIQHYLPALRKGNNPSILMFSTVASKLGMPFHSSVAAAKSGVEGLVRSLGAELSPTIRVNAIAPTITKTELASKLLRNEQMEEKMKERHPLKKILSPEEVANMAAFLISDKALSLSGQIFEMDCGIVSFKI
jgi:NAD(P)-dependent dehydrogenase (short-subunit alcohol dehydrogenase family)